MWAQKSLKLEIGRGSYAQNHEVVQLLARISENFRKLPYLFGSLLPNLTHVSYQIWHMPKFGSFPRPARRAHKYKKGCRSHHKKKEKIIEIQKRNTTQYKRGEERPQHTTPDKGGLPPNHHPFLHPSITLKIHLWNQEENQEEDSRARRTRRRHI